MGASTFFDIGTGATSQEAFVKLVSNALYENGHDGYTGTIAEKCDYTVVGEVNTVEEAYQLAYKLIDNRDPRIDDKWGDAGAVVITSKPGTYLFFGWASD